MNIIGLGFEKFKLLMTLFIYILSGMGVFKGDVNYVIQTSCRMEK